MLFEGSEGSSEGTGMNRYEYYNKVLILSVMFMIFYAYRNSVTKLDLQWDTTAKSKWE